jgi:site-specific recombinase XerD
LLAQPNTININERKHLVLMSLMYDTGARVQEIADLKISDIIFNDNTLIKIKGKGDKYRLVPIDTKMSNLLRQYLQDYKLTNIEKQNDFLFCNHSNNKMTRQGITYIVKKYYLKAYSCNNITNLITISPHILRHSRAVHLLMSGVDLIYIRDILGHSSVKTTEIYARINTEYKRKALEKLADNSINDQLPEWQTDKNLFDWLNSFKLI